jgi:hypothetical protein
MGSLAINNFGSKTVSTVGEERYGKTVTTN